MHKKSWNPSQSNQQTVRFMETMAVLISLIQSIEYSVSQAKTITTCGCQSLGLTTFHYPFKIEQLAKSFKTLQNTLC